MTAAVVQLARIFELEAVIEGIENETHLEIIQDMRADFGQGFYFAKPLSGADAMAFTVEQARAGQAAGRAPLAVLPTSE